MPTPTFTVGELLAAPGLVGVDASVLAGALYGLDPATVYTIAQAQARVIAWLGSPIVQASPQIPLDDRPHAIIAAETNRLPGDVLVRGADGVWVNQQPTPASGGTTPVTITDVTGLQTALNAKQDAATAATDTELQSATASLTSAINLKQDTSAAASQYTTLVDAIALKQDAATAVSNAELTSALAGYATTAALTTATTGLATTAALNAAIAPLATSAALTTAVTGLASTTYVDTAIAAGAAIQTITTSGTLTTAARGVLADATGGGMFVTLPDAAAYSARLRVTATHSNANIVGLVPAAGQDIDGATIVILGPQISGAQWESVDLVSTGSAWRIA